MTYTFPMSALRPRRRIALSSLALIVVAATAGYATHRFADAWSESQTRAESKDPWGERPNSRVIRVTGTGTAHLTPSRATWSVTLSVEARDDLGVRRELARQRNLVLAALAEMGVSDSDVRVREATVDTQTRVVTRTARDGSTTDETVPNGYFGIQTIEVTSTDVPSIVASYARASRNDLAILGALSEPECTQDIPPELEPTLVRDAERDLRRNAEQLVQTLGHSELGALDGVEFGPISLGSVNEGGVPLCVARTASLEMAAVYHLR